MNKRYLFIDETGDLGEKGSRFFVITAIWVEQPELLDRIIKNMKRNKFKKELKAVHELKANNSSIKVKEHILKKLIDIDSFRAHSIILDKSRLYSEYLKNDKNKLYNYVCGILGSTLCIDSKNITVRIDRSKGKQALLDDFNTYIKNKFKEGCWNRKIEIHHSWSHSWSGLQMADFVSWAVFHKYEHDNDCFIKIIEKRININHVWK